jgi:hypothetical protein
VEERAYNVGRQITHLTAIREIEVKLNKLRALLSTINSEVFKRLYEAADTATKYYADEAIANKDYDGLRRWIKERRLTCLESYNVRELRELARNNNITNYSRLDRVELIRQVKRVLDIGEITNDISRVSSPFEESGKCQ